MSTFMNQIKEDIEEYQNNFSFIEKIKKDEWAFNYWILDKLFKVDEELIESKIIDYHDMGVDAYDIYDDAKEIFLIQNKFFSDSSKLAEDYVKNDFLLRPINALKQGTYKHCEELQNAFTKYKEHDDFRVYLEIYVTNNAKNEKISDYIKEFNQNNPKYVAKIYYLDDISEKYFGEIKENKQKLEIKIESVNKGTVLNINTENYKLQNVLDARYVMTPVASIYNFYSVAKEKKYPIFEKNIREFLGNKGVNKKIYETLLDVDERKNFFYYNNGITMICDSMTTINTQNSNNNMNAFFQVQNPQIVNGCQSVNSIFEALKNIDPEKLEDDFKDTFVMVKILVIDRSEAADQQLYKKIVQFNNSQNAINEKTFVANMAVFQRLQKEFISKGLLVIIKQSDKHQFKEKYKNNSSFKEKIRSKFEKFDIVYNRLTDLYVPLEKLMQVINAFVQGGQVAYTKKSNMLKQDSVEYNTSIDFIKNNSITTDNIIDLYLLYKLAEQEKKKSVDGRTPIPYYLIDMFAKYDCVDRNEELISKKLNNSKEIKKIIKLYSAVSKAYVKNYYKESGLDYNKMIKQSIKYDMLSTYRESMYESFNVEG